MTAAKLRHLLSPRAVRAFVRGTPGERLALLILSLDVQRVQIVVLATQDDVERWQFDMDLRQLDFLLIDGTTDGSFQIAYGFSVAEGLPIGLPTPDGERFDPPPAMAARTVAKMMYRPGKATRLSEGWAAKLARQ